jgi:hypothetical protein
MPWGRGGSTVRLACNEEEDHTLAKPNYQYEKRQKDLAKKKKQEEKRLRKQNRGATEPGEAPAEPAADAVPSQK